MPVFNQVKPNQKGIINIILIFLVLLGIGIGIYLVQHPAIFKPHASQDPSLCQASDPTSFKDCLAQAQTNEVVNKIEVTKQITCRSKEECGGGGFALTKRTSALTIFGTPNTNAGFKRVAKYDYPLLILGDFGRTNDVSNVTLKDLVFDDTIAACDFVVLGTATCNTPLVLGPKISNSVVDNIKILHAKNMGLEIIEANHLTVKNSLVFDSEGDGIWTSTAYTDAGCNVDYNNFVPCDIDPNKISRDVNIENNFIIDNNIAGIEYYGNGSDAQNPAKITGNFLIHNHRNAKYKNCPPPDGHCPGGQLSVARSKWVTVEDNVIRDGIINAVDPANGRTYDSQGLLASGIELADSLKNITVQYNKIYNNKGAGIFADYVGSKYKIEDVAILGNVIYGNGAPILGSANANLSSANGFKVESNIFTSSKAIYLPKVYIFNDPPICNAQTASGQCTTTVRWYSADYTGFKVTIMENPGSIFANADNGAEQAPWIGAAGATFQVINSNNQVFASTFAKSDAQVASPSPANSASLSPSASPIPSTSFLPYPGILSASPNPCTITSGQTCTSTISWSSSFSDLKITLKENPGSLFAQAPSGSVDAPWISTSGATFEAYSGGVLKDSLFVRGISASPNPSPSISSSAAPDPTIRVGDLNHDEHVDISDLNIFIIDYGNGNLRSDLNHDGGLDISDLNLLIQNYDH